MVPRRGNLIQPRVSETPQESSATLGKSPPPNPAPCRGATNLLNDRERERGAA